MDKEATVERVGGYRVVRRLATGGTSDVLLARAEGPHGFERTVVLKLLLSQYRNDPELAQMFAREAAAYARLSHPSIVRLFDFFALDGQLVMVLEYVDGPPLSRLRGMLKAVGQPLDDKGAIYVAQRVFAALASAHAATDANGAAAPVIHRDVNPSNVLVPWDGHVKLADFGIAKVSGSNHQSQAGLIKGTFGYMAPEQITGDPVTPRADVYGGAIVLWEMLTKRRAFQRGALPEIEVLRQMSEPKITSLDVLRPDVDRNVREAMRRALEPSADRRTITAEEMASTLRDVVPSEDGREHLTKALAAVRHEPKPAPSNIPSPSEETPALRIPGPAPVPRPRSVQGSEATERARSSTLGYDAAASSTSRPAATPKPPPTKPTPPPGTVKGVQASPSTKPLPPMPVPRKPTPPPLAKTMPLATTPPGKTEDRATEVPTPMSLPPSTNPSMPPQVQIFDDYVEAPELVAQRRISERIRAAKSPVQEIAGGKPLREAIDDILQSVPSSIPPQMFPDSNPPGVKRTPAPPIGANLGRIPAPPPVLTPMPTPQNGIVPFTMLDRTVAMGSRPVPANPDVIATVRPPDPVGAKTSTDKMPKYEVPRGTEVLTPSISTAAPALSEAIAQSLLSPPHGLSAVAETGAQPIEPPIVDAPVTEPLLPSAGLSGFAHTAPLAMPTPSAPHPGSAPPMPPSAPPRQQSGASFSGALASVTASGPPPKRRNGVAIVGLVVLLLGAVGIGGAFGFLRWRQAHAVITAPTVATVIVPSTAVVLPSATASASVSVAVPVETASAAVSASASATPIASASAAPSASASAGEIPAGMGVLKSDNAPPGHRIFVDDRVVGETPTPITVKCGGHFVKIGSNGFKRPVDVPCGGELTLER